MQADEEKVPSDEQENRDVDMQWEMVCQRSNGVSRTDPLLHPHCPADPQIIAGRKLHYHPEHIGEMDGANPAETVPKVGAPSCEMAPTSGTGLAVGVTQVSADATNAASQVGASSCERAPTSGAGSAAAVPDQEMGDAAEA